MQPVGFVPGRDRFIGDETRGEPLPALAGRLGASEILGVGSLEEAAPMLCFPFVVVILDGEHAVVQRAGALRRV